MAIKLSDEMKTILVIMPDKHLGNLVVSIPAIRALIERYGDKKFYLVVDSAYREIVETVDGINKLILYPREELRSSSIIKHSVIFLRFIWELRRAKADMAIDLEGREVSSTITCLSGASLRVGSSSAKRAFFYNMKGDIREGRHRVYSYLDIASAAGAHSKSEICRLQASETRKASLKTILHNKGIIIEKPLVCIHPGAGKIYKQWSLNGFADISDWLASKDYQVVFIGNKIEVDNIMQIISRLKNNVYNLAGELSLGELMALFGTISLYLGNDSGPMHLAAAMGAPVIALFGPGTDRRWHPLTEKTIVLRGDEQCAKCKGKDCEYDFKCIKTLSPDDVKTAINKLIIAQ